jgi:upstream activation factor subunit UAF30
MSGKQPSDDELKVKIRALIPNVNLEKTGIKAFIKLLSKECGGAELKPRTDFIRAELSAAINDMSSEDEESETEEEEEAPKKKRAAGKGLSVKKEISDELADFLGQGKEMGRTDIVKALWDYIKEHDLQNPENKREILLDDKMKKVFGCSSFTMFTMNKYVGAHVHPFKPVDLTPKPPKPPKNEAKKSEKAPKKRKKASEESSSPKKKKRKPKKPGLQPPYKLSETMANVVGTDILPRPQVVTALWDYIKKNGLQVRILTVKDELVSFPRRPLI